MKPEHKEFNYNGRHCSYDCVDGHAISTDKSLQVGTGVIKEHIDYLDDAKQVKLFAEFIPNEYSPLHIVCMRTYKGKDLSRLKREANEEGHRFESKVEKMIKIATRER